MKLRSMLILLFVILFSGCSNGGGFQSDYTGEMAMEETAVVRAVPSNSDLVKNEALSTQTIVNSERMMIYQANLSLEVKDYAKVEGIIQERASEIGGYVVESSIYYSGEDWINGNLIVKVPQEFFHSFINEVESKSSKIYDRHISGNDVTEEYIDLDARLRSKRIVEERLLEFMEKAEKTEDLLQISNDLATIQQEIEQLLGRMKYLQTNVDFSTVTIHLSEKLVTVPSIQDNEALNTWIKAKRLFMDSVIGVISFFSTMIVFVIGLSPIFVPIISIFVIVLWRKRKKQNQKPSQI